MLRSLKGARFEEILGLRRKDIDLVHATIQIEESRTIGVDGKSITKQPKTSAGRRKLALPAPLGHTSTPAALRETRKAS
jgi:integrase